MTPEGDPRERLTGLAALFRQQARACAELGSPMYAGILTRMSDDLLAGGVVADVLACAEVDALLAAHAEDLPSSAVALRLMGTVHRLVLEGRAPGLARFFPSVGGRADVNGAWPATVAVLEEHREEIRAGFAQAPQTNEIGRAAALLGGLLHVRARHPMPLRLLEVGASAGLNLRADRFRLRLRDGTGIGPETSSVVLVEPWEGRSPPLHGGIEVVERAGCDTAPLDPTTEDGRLRLTSYVWPDQVDRLERLRGALELAARVPATLVRQGAAAFLHRVELAPGTTTVVWHSVMWQYLPSDEQAAMVARIAELGEQVTADTALAHLRLEPETRGGRHAFFVVLRTWPGAEERVLGTAHPHGVPTTWA